MRHKADILTSEGRPDEAIPLYQKLVEGEPDDDSHLLSLASCYASSGENNLAAKTLKGIKMLEGRKR